MLTPAPIVEAFQAPAIPAIPSTIAVPIAAPIFAGIAVAAGIKNIAGIAKAERGADYVTSGPQMLMVGDNPGGRERVQVTPQGSGGGMGGMSVNMAIHIAGNADASTVRAIERTRERQLFDLRKMLIELGSARQMPRFA